jgi:calcineurin-like phosphoesterase family protein
MEHKVFFTADSHFNHSNIIKYEDRPFLTSSEMDRAMINNWNKVVAKKDTIFHLGDFSLGLNKEQLIELLKKLHGKKILIEGNHDRGHRPSFWRDVGFFEAIDFPIIYNDYFILCHEPVYLNEHMPYRCVHGHIHSRSYDSNLYFNVSVERTNYTPVSFEEIIAKLNIKR